MKLKRQHFTSVVVNLSQTKTHSTVSRINKRVKVWGDLSMWNSVIQQTRIKEGIDKFHRDIDVCMMKFQVCPWVHLSVNITHKYIKGSHRHRTISRAKRSQGHLRA